MPACGIGAEPPPEALRVRLAAHPETAPALLQHLGEDPSVTVRAALALNPAAPADLHRLLAQDTDERVRALLGRKLALLVPQLADSEREDVERQALATLENLVEDEALRVRSAIADVLKDMPQAPRALILRLARDSAVPISEPVIRLSPVLTPGDLLALLRDLPARAQVIAARPGLDAAVSDAIAATADSAAIAALLANTSAAIREATLDALAERAAEHEAWHDPLVRRPRLSSRAAKMLSEVVTGHLLEVLAARSDLDHAVVAELQQRLSQRLAPAAAAPDRACATLDDAVARAQSLFARGLLDEMAVQEAAQRGDLQLCTAMLAVAADMPAATVERAARLRNAKGLVSLVWAGGFSMKLGSAVQSELGSVAPGAVLRATATGDFPLEPDEMRWHMDLLKRSTR